MTKTVAWAIFTLLLLFPVSAGTQTQTPRLAYVYVTYFECNPATEARADEIIARSYAPHYNAAVEHGDILGWSWLAHFVGGKWRRALVLNAADMDSVLDASGALGEIIEESTPEAGRAFSETCPVHEDYIWQATDGLSSTLDGNAAGAVRFSMYMQCDMADEDRTDELMREHIAPIYNRKVAEGELGGWAILQHNLGGQWRRLLTMSADDHRSLMRTRAAIVEEVAGGRTERALRQINEACPLHQDYLWDVQIQTP